MWGHLGGVEEISFPLILLNMRVDGRSVDLLGRSRQFGLEKGAFGIDANLYVLGVGNHLRRLRGLKGQITSFLEYPLKIDHWLTINDSGLTLIDLRESVRLMNKFGVIAIVGSTRNPLKRFVRWILVV